MAHSLGAHEVASVGARTQRAALDVLHVIAPCEVGGAERVVQALSAGQHRAGHRVHVAAVLGRQTGDHPFLRPLAEAGVDVVPLSFPPRGYLRERAAIVEICRRIRPDVVHTHGYRIDVADAGAVRRLGVPTVTTVHGFTGGGWKNRLFEGLQRRAFRRFDAVVAVSRALAGDLVRSGVSAERLHVVPNAWWEMRPPLPAQRARRLLAVPERRFHVGWVGRLGREKAPDTLLAALEQLDDLPLTASVLGDGPLRARLEALAARRGLADRVRWWGNLSDAARVFPGFDVFVLSSRTEGTPIVLFEAMAAGTPVVATTVGGVPDVVSTHEAVLVPPDDPAALARAIRCTYADSTAAAARAGHARERLAREFAVAPWLTRYERIYRSVL